MRAAKYIKEKLIELNGEIFKPTIIFVQFNTSFLIVITNQQKISNDILNNIINQPDLLFVEYSAQHPQNMHSLQVHVGKD